MTLSNKDICCPQFNPKRYQEKSFVWKDKPFLKDSVVQFMHIPLNFSQVITRMFKKVTTAKAAPKDTDFLILAYDPSPWKSELYMTVTKEIPNGEMTKLSGNYLTKVYDGPYNAVPQWIKDMDEYVAKKGKKVKKYFFHYAYCPKCSKKYGHNYTVAFAQV